MRFLPWLLALTLGTPSYAGPLTQRLLERLAEECSAFERTAPNLITEETLRQRAQKPAQHRFIPRVEAPLPTPPEPEWQTREIVSEYAFASAGDPPSLRELRKVLSVDGKTVATNERAVRDLLRTLQASDDRSRRKLLEEFEKHGLIGTVTDFGQLLLLFARRNQELYGFLPRDEQLLGAERCQVFAYQQQDGPGVLTIYDSKGRAQPRVSGEIWVSSESYRVLRITMKSTRGQAAGAIRDEAEVNYTMSSHGVLVPVAVTHREYRSGQVTAENLFTYAPFRRFGSSADIKFNEAPAK